jgi:hypothetical protein
MIKLLIEMLPLVEYDEGGEAIKTAKGKYQLPTNWKAIKRYAKEKADGRR